MEKCGPGWATTVQASWWAVQKVEEGLKRAAARRMAWFTRWRVRMGVWVVFSDFFEIEVAITAIIAPMPIEARMTRTNAQTGSMIVACMIYMVLFFVYE